MGVYKELALEPYLWYLVYKNPDNTLGVLFFYWEDWDA